MTTRQNSLGIMGFVHLVARIETVYYTPKTNACSLSYDFRKVPCLRQTTLYQIEKKKLIHLQLLPSLIAL